MIRFFKQNWFVVGLAVIFAVILADSTGVLVSGGKWTKANHGPDLAIFTIFLISGILLDPEKIRGGITDLSATALACLIIFIIAPLVGALVGTLPLETGIVIGFFLVSVMPTTLSSGIIMSTIAGGNTAHALLVSLLSNMLAIFTIPLTLSLLLFSLGANANIALDPVQIMLKIAGLVLLPLFLGILLQRLINTARMSLATVLQNANQILILSVVWMGLSHAAQTMAAHGSSMFLIFILSIFYHGGLLGMCFLLIRLFKLGPGRRESVIFMGSQKTLPLSLMLQVSLFPEYPTALVVCVLHHITQLFMDGYLAGKMRKMGTFFRL